MISLVVVGCLLLAFVYSRWHAHMKRSRIAAVHTPPSSVLFRSRKNELTVGFGAVLFLVINLVIWFVANPRFPNQSGPMPAWLPYLMLGMVLALAILAARYTEWRRVAAGAVLTFAIISTRGCTEPWSQAMANLVHRR